MNNPWEVLKIEPTDDLRTIKSAYAKLIKNFRPEESPEEFKKIREAYETIINMINNGEDFTQQSNFETQNKSQTKQLNEREKLFAALDYLMGIYDNPETKNNVKEWKRSLNEQFLTLNLENLLNTGHNFLREILKCEFLYKTDIKLQTDVFITLFDFFGLDYKSYLLENYNINVAKPLVEEIRERKIVLRGHDLSSSKFNEYVREYQVTGEMFLEEEILPYSSQELSERQPLLVDMLSKKSYAEKEVMGRVAFKYVLINYLRADINIDPFKIAFMYRLFSFDSKKKVFIKIFSEKGYHKQDVINCLESCKESYQSIFGTEKPSNKPLIFIIVIIFLIYRFMKFKLSS